MIEEARNRTRFVPFNILHRESALRADIYLAGDDPLHAWAFTRRRAERMSEGEVLLAPIECVIVRQLEFFRDGGSDRHRSEIACIFRVSGAELDCRHSIDWSKRADSWSSGCVRRRVEATQ